MTQGASLVLGAASETLCAVALEVVLPAAYESTQVSLSLSLEKPSHLPLI